LSVSPEVLIALAAVAPLLAVELAKAARWRSLCGPERPSYSVSLRALVAGQVTNALSPLRAGEAVRLGVLAAQGGPLVAGAGALAGAKAVDVVCLVAIAVAVVGAATLSHARWGAVAACTVIVAGVLASVFGRPLRSWLERWSLSHKLHLGALVDVAESLRDRRTLALVVGTTALVWAAGLAANGVVLLAVGVSPTFDLMGRMLVAGYVVGLVPAPPIRLGVYETGITVALTSGGVPLQQAVTAAVALHVCQLAELGLLVAVGVLSSRWRVSSRALGGANALPGGRQATTPPPEPFPSQ
jgi:uncharacterized membrane protein YbhN (UPF0104 family)